MLDYVMNSEVNQLLDCCKLHLFKPYFQLVIDTAERLVHPIIQGPRLWVKLFISPLRSECELCFLLW